ncbi:MAG TPA: metallophosphoesterase [Nocardioides sp.]
MRPSLKAPAMLAAGAALSVMGAALVVATPTTSEGSAAKNYTYTFVSSPDFLNTDVGDVAGAPGYAAWKPNSTNSSYRDALAYVLHAFKAEGPQDVLVAGDLVQGHWGKDTEHTGTFGPVSDDTKRRAAVKAAAAVYFRQWKSRFNSRDLDVHAALGDHDIGDNPWDAHKNAYAAFKQRNVALFKSLFHKYVTGPNGYAVHPSGPAAGTAYAVRLDPDVLLVTVDVFQRTTDNVAIRIDPQQLAWLDTVLARADANGVKWIFVQGHTPVIGPVRKQQSSGLTYYGGAKSGFWHTMARHHVDLYLCGEVHATTAIHDNATGITQICHGGLFDFGLTTYLTGRVYADGSRIDLDTTGFDFTSSLEYDRTARLWQTDMNSTKPPEVIAYSNPHTTGRMTLTSDNTVVSRSGMLGVYTP